MKDESGQGLPWKLFLAEMIGTALLVLVLVGLSLVIVMFGAGSLMIRLIPDESIYDWENSQWTVPINATIGQMIKVGKRPISLEAGYRYYAEKSDGGPEWGLRLFIKFLFPR